MTVSLAPIARVMRQLRAEQAVDQLDLGLATGASDGSYLSKLENGHAGNPSASFLARYVDAFRVLGHALSDDQRKRLAAAILIGQSGQHDLGRINPLTPPRPVAFLARGLNGCAQQRWTRDDLAAVDLSRHRDLLCLLAVLALDTGAADRVVDCSEPQDR